MKKLLLLSILSVLLISCEGNDKLVLPNSVGRVNKVLVVTKSSLWLGKVGDEIRNSFGELQVGLPQPETLLSVSQVAPEGYQKMMKNGRNIIIIEESETENFTVKRNIYAKPQTVIYLSAKDKDAIVEKLKSQREEIISTFKNADLKLIQNNFYKKKLDDSKYKTLQNLGVSLTIPKEFRTVDDTGDFLWLRQHLMGGIAKGTGSNNILVYSYPLDSISNIAEGIVSRRDSIGKKHIPGSKEGMFMITERAYTPHTFDAEVAGKKAYETRGTWEVLNDFMAGPFVNYTIVDEANNRLLIVEGFTYAPSINKRNLVFELEAIAKSIKFN